MKTILVAIVLISLDCLSMIGQTNDSLELPVFSLPMFLGKYIPAGDSIDSEVNSRLMDRLKRLLISGILDSGVTNADSALQVVGAPEADDNYFDITRGMESLPDTRQTGVKHDKVDSLYAEVESLINESLRLSQKLYAYENPTLAQTIDRMKKSCKERNYDVMSDAFWGNLIETFNHMLFEGYIKRLIYLSNVALRTDRSSQRSNAELICLEFVHLTRQLQSSVACYDTERDQLQIASVCAWQDAMVINMLARVVGQRPAVAGMLAELAMDRKASILGHLAQQRRRLADLKLRDAAAAAVWQRYADASGRVELHLHTIPADTARYCAWLQDLISLETQRDEAERHLAHTVSGLSGDDTTDWHSVRQALGPDEAAVEFLNVRYHDGRRWTDSTFYYAIVICPGKNLPTVLRLCEARELEALLRLTENRTNAYLSDADANTQLYQHAFAPLELTLAGVRTIYLSPSGQLSRVSFAALQDTNRRYLADRFDLRYVSNTKALARSGPIVEGMGNSIRTAAIFGGEIYDLDTAAMLRVSTQARRIGGTPDVQGGDIPDDSIRQHGLDYLSGSRREADSLSQLLKHHGWDVECDTALRAVEERFKSLMSPTVLHVATHGFFFAESGYDTAQHDLSLQGANVFRVVNSPMLRTGLLLSGAERAWNGQAPPQGVDDGIVTAYEIASMNLSKTKLVVLSACETGLGDIHGSEGVFGLQRAFRIAGARSVLITLWEVKDGITEQFMHEFYVGWLKGKTLHRAFADAQAAIRVTAGVPEGWAAYVLVER